MDININSKYIILYIDDEINKNYKIIENINSTNNIGIVIFLLNNEDKIYDNNKSILEIYPDNYIEDILISNSLFIIYLSYFKRSTILQELIQKYNKIVLYNKQKLFDDINLFLDNNYIINENHNAAFIDHYNSLKEIVSINYNKNIKIELHKKIIEQNKLETNDNEKINIVTFYKHFNDNNILNTIQKTCIMQNLKNKDVNKILIIGYNLKDTFENENNKIILYDLIYEKIVNLLDVETEDEEDLKDEETEEKEDLKDEETEEDSKDEETEDSKSTEDEEDNIDLLINKESFLDKELLLETFVNENISFTELIKITNNIFNDNNIVCILRSDIVIQNQDNIDFIDLNIELSKKKIFSISRLDRCINSKIIKSQRLSNNLFSTEQDAWLFKTPILLNDESFKLLENKYLYNQYEHLYLNKILIKNDYHIVNNTILKILRILSNNDIDKRELLIEKNIENYNLDDIFLLPESDIVNKLPFEHLIKISGIDENEVYKIKCYFFNKYLKNKIINNI